jgi:hypothetical protein
MKINFTKYLSAVLLSFVMVTAVANAQPTGSTTNPTTGSTQNVNATLQNPFSGTGNRVDQLLNAIIDRILLPIGSIVAVMAFIWSGFLFVMAQGNESKLGDAKRALLYTAIGTAILLGATVLSRVITGTIDSLR